MHYNVHLPPRYGWYGLPSHFFFFGIVTILKKLRNTRLSYYNNYIYNKFNYRRILLIIVKYIFLGVIKHKNVLTNYIIYRIYMKKLLVEKINRNQTRKKADRPNHYFLENSDVSHKKSLHLR